MTRELTVKEYAERERVEERTVRRWIEKGAVEVRRTPGGGIRIPDHRKASSSAMSAYDE
jgi:excisionase family DNA binding protein